MSTREPSTATEAPASAPVGRWPHGLVGRGSTAAARVSPVYLAVKRLLDVVLAAVVLLLSLPLLAILALFVKLESRGRALYAAERVGQGGRAFVTRCAPCAPGSTIRSTATICGT